MENTTKGEESRLNPRIADNQRKTAYLNSLLSAGSVCGQGKLLSKVGLWRLDARPSDFRSKALNDDEGGAMQNVWLLVVHLSVNVECSSQR